MFLLEFGRRGHTDVFEDLDERVRFLSRATRLARPRGIHLLAWSLEDQSARLLVECDVASLQVWVRLVQSGHGVDLFHRGRDYVEWDSPVPIPMGDVGEALGILYYRADRSPWSSVWEALSVRAWPGAPDPTARIPAELHLLAAPVSSPDRDLDGPQGVTWPRMRSALHAATGRPASSRHNAVAVHQLASRCGYRHNVIARVRGVSGDAVRKSLRRDVRPEVDHALCWLSDPVLGRLLDEASTVRVPCPPRW